jgi:hypothetical protein
MKKKAFIFLLITCLFVYIEILQNVDDNAPIPQVTRNNTFVITEYSKDEKYVTTRTIL